MFFTPSDGEPNWSQRLYSKDGQDDFMSPTDDNSYEEYRMLVMDQFRVPRLRKLSGCVTPGRFIPQQLSKD